MEGVIISYMDKGTLPVAAACAWNIYIVLKGRKTFEALLDGSGMNSLVLFFFIFLSIFSYQGLGVIRQVDDDAHSTSDTRISYGNVSMTCR